MLRWIGIGILFVLLCAEVLARGPLELKVPQTIVSNASTVLKISEPYLVFLHGVAARVPRGATLAIRTPNPLWYFVAIGQLPEQTVLPATAERGPLDGPETEWVACYFANLDDPRYERVESSMNGSLHRRRR
jgi:hypothetical protein